MLTMNRTRFQGLSTLGTVSITFFAERSLLIQPMILLDMKQLLHWTQISASNDFQEKNQCNSSFCGFCRLM